MPLSGGSSQAGMEPEGPVSPALAGGLFTTWATPQGRPQTSWETACTAREFPLSDPLSWLSSL